MAATVTREGAVVDGAINGQLPATGDLRIKDMTNPLQPGRQRIPYRDIEPLLAGPPSALMQSPVSTRRWPIRA